MIAEKCTKTSSPVWRWMNPNPFEALNHFTVPCSFTCKPHMRNSDRVGVVDIGIALRLSVRFQRPQNLCLQPLERIRGWYKSSKRQVNSTTKSDLCPRPCADPERVELPSKQLKIKWLVGYGR